MQPIFLCDLASKFFLIIFVYFLTKKKKSLENKTNVKNCKTEEKSKKKKITSTLHITKFFWGDFAVQRVLKRLSKKNKINQTKKI